MSLISIPVPVPGRAKINYIEDESSDSKNKKKESSDGSKSIHVEQGDVYRLKQGTTFYIRSYPAPTRVKFRIYAIFNTVNVEDPRVRIAFLMLRKNDHSFCQNFNSNFLCIYLIKNM